MNKQIKFVKFPTVLSDEQLLDLEDHDSTDGYSCQDMILLNEGVWLVDGQLFETRSKHYISLYHIVKKRSEE